MVGAALFLAALSVYSVFVGLNALAAIGVVGSLLTGFTAGYLFRQAVIDRRRLPWARWLWLRGDPLLDEIDGACMDAERDDTGPSGASERG